MSYAKKYMILWLPPLLLIAGFLCKDLLIPVVQWVADHVLFCVFNETTGLYCMGCGGTRSMKALLHGDILLALHNNPAAPALVIILILLYIEKVAAVFDKKLRILPRSLAFWLILFAIQAVWNIIRNFVPAMFPIT